MDSPAPIAQALPPSARFALGSIRWTHVLVWIFFFLSGACGLIYEVLWCRHLGLLFGNTAHSLSTVLVAFMGGLAIGSFLAGRYADRIERPFLLYGVLEIVIGVYCAILPVFFGNDSPLIPLYRSLYGESGSSSLVAVRLVVSLLLLVLPTICMGATLPLLTHHLVRTKATMGRTVGALYAVNSLGAVTGAVLAGFVLLPLLGKTSANLTAVVCNLALGAVAIAMGWNDRVPKSGAETAASTTPPPPTQPLIEQAPVSPATVKIAILSFGLTGFAAMATQIGWTKAISLGTGSSTYAFSMIVAVFILGLSFGGAWGARVATRVREPLALLARVLLLTAFLNMAVAVLLGYSPILFFAGLAWGTQHGWSAVLLSQVLIIALLIFGPTFLMGASMPLTLQVASRGTSGAARTTGNVYAVNTLGSILGSALGGLLIVPLFSVQVALELMCVLYALPGLILFYKSESRGVARERLSTAGLVAATVVIALVGGRWDPALMSAGLYLMRNDALIERVRGGDLLAAVPNFSDRQVLYHAEGAEATVTVLQVPNQLTLKVGGKPEGSTSGDATTQTFLTLLPELLHPTGPKDVLLIGLGTGVSAGSALAPQSVERVDAVEMSPEVVHASAWFDSVNRLKYSSTGAQRWIDTDRMNTIVNDGRNHLLLTSRRYDVISCEPSNPWMAGVGNLFTREAFELSRQRLKPGGIMCQWIHSYSLDRQWFNSVVRTFGEVFPHVQLWQLQHRDFLLIGTEEPLKVSLDEFKKRIGEPGVQTWLKDVHAETIADMLSMHLAQGTPLLNSVARAPLHTDDNMLLEFNAPRSLQLAHADFEPSDYLPRADPLADFETLPFSARSELKSAVDRHIAARERDRFGARFGNYAGNMPAAQRLASEIRPVLAWQHAMELQRAAELTRGVNRPPSAEELEQAVRLIEQASKRLAYIRSDYEHLDRTRLSCARALIDAGKFERAVDALKEMRHFLAERDLLLAEALVNVKDFAGARVAAQTALRDGADAAESTYWLVQSEILSGSPDTARGILDQFLARHQHERTAAMGRLWLIHGQMMLDANQIQAALGSAGQALLLHRKRDESRLLESRIYRKMGNFSANVEALRQRAYLLPESDLAWTSYTFARLEMVDSLLRVNDTDTARVHLELARRLSEEFTVIYPQNFRAWEARARTLLFYARTEPKEPGYAAAANDALKKMLACLDNDPTKAPPDLQPLLAELPRTP